MPSGAVEQQDGVRAHGDMARDFIEMKLHGGSVGEGQSERRALAARRTDRAEEIGILVALIGRLARARAALGPLPHEAVLLADASFILKQISIGTPFATSARWALSVCAKFFYKPRRSRRSAPDGAGAR